MVGRSYTFQTVDKAPHSCADFSVPNTVNISIYANFHVIFWYNRNIRSRQVFLLMMTQSEALFYEELLQKEINEDRETHEKNMLHFILLFGHNYAIIVPQKGVKHYATYYAY